MAAGALRAIIIGAGGIGALYRHGPGGPRNHAAALVGRRDLSLVGAVDPAPDRRAAFERAFGRPAWGPSQPGPARGVDVAIVATPPAAHRESVALAVRLGARAVLCEKPLGTSADDARGIEALARAAGARLLVNYSRRFDPATLRVLEAIRGGVVGDVRRVGVAYCRGLRNNGSHALDLGLAMLGPLTAGLAANRLGEVGDDPTLDAWLTSAAGVPFDLTAYPAGSYHTFRVEVAGTLGALCIDGRTACVRRAMGDPLTPPAPAETLVEGVGDGAITAALDDLVAAATKRASSRCGPAEALAVWRLLDDLTARAPSAVALAS